MSKETPNPEFDLKKPENRGEFGVDKESQVIEGHPRETRHVPFDDDDSIRKAHEKGAVADGGESGSLAREAESISTPETNLETSDNETDQFIEDHVVNKDGVEAKDAHAVLNNLLERTQK